MAIDYQVFTDVTDVCLGGVDISGVRKISIERQRRQFHAAGDDDVHESVARACVCGLSGTIELLDLAQAASLGGAGGTLSFKWRDARGAADKTVTISSVSVVGAALAAGNRAASAGSLSFVSESSDGLADPVTVS